MDLSSLPGNLHGWDKEYVVDGGEMFPFIPRNDSVLIYPGDTRTFGILDLMPWGNGTMTRPRPSSANP